MMKTMKKTSNKHVRSKNKTMRSKQSKQSGSGKREKLSEKMKTKLCKHGYAQVKEILESEEELKKIYDGNIQLRVLSGFQFENFKKWVKDALNIPKNKIIQKCKGKVNQCQDEYNQSYYKDYENVHEYLAICLKKIPLSDYIQ